MIPKRIYTTWISDKPMPDKFIPYIEGWKKIMPDFEVRIIDLENVTKSEFVKKAIDRGNYVLAGHYGRCERLYEEGGLYFDADVEAIKDFTPLLDKPFIGREDAGMVNNAVMGFEKGHPMMKECLDIMDNIDIDTPDIILNTSPWMFNRIYGKYDIMVYPEEYFYPYHYTKTFTPDCIKENTYAVHHWAKTWG